MLPLNELNRAYAARFDNLADGTQAQIHATLDAGGEVISVYDLATGKTVCSIVSADTTRIPIWEFHLAETEADVLGHAVQDALNLLPIDYKTGLNAKLADGWQLQVVVRHDGQGAMLVNLVRDGYTIEVVRLKTDPTLH